MGNDIKYMPEKLEQASNFANKIWNAAKFINMSRASDEEIIKFEQQHYESSKGIYAEDTFKVEDKWIINKLNKLVREITENIEKYDLGVALDKIYNFIWNDFCNWYIEMAKIRLNNQDNQKESSESKEKIEDKIRVSFVLNYVFSISMKLLHPFMPFVTSEIYNNLVHASQEELMISKWPEYNNNLEFKREEEIIEKIQQIIVEIRNIRNEKQIHSSKKAELIVVTNKYEKEVRQLESLLLKLGYGNSIKIQEDKKEIPEDSLSIITDGIELYMPIQGLINIEEERKRLEEERKRLEAEVARCEKMLSNPGFVNKAPEAKVIEERAKLEKYKDMLEKVKERL